MLSESSSDNGEHDDEDGERTPPKQIPQQRGMFQGFTNEKLSFKNKIFTEDKNIK